MKSLQDFFTRFLSFETNVDAQFKEFSKVREENAQLRSDLETSRKQITEHSAEASKLKADLEARDKEIATLKAQAQTADQIASHKAAQITAAQGQPPIPLSPEANPATPKGPELKGLARTVAALEKNKA